MNVLAVYYKLNNNIINIHAIINNKINKIHNPIILYKYIYVQGTIYIKIKYILLHIILYIIIIYPI